jgi:hypothetical protein
MRIALWVVVVAIHLLVIWLFTASRRGVREEEPVFAAISPLPVTETLQSEPVPPRKGGAIQHGKRTHMEQGERLSPEPIEENVPAPDWRAQAAVVAESRAHQIVTDEDDAQRRANALKAPYKPMPGPRVRGPTFGWDPMPKHHLTPAGHGTFVLPVGDQCALVFFIIMPTFGCSLGSKPEANGDLFKYMRGPVKYGDWDWRVKDP